MSIAALLLERMLPASCPFGSFLLSAGRRTPKRESLANWLMAASRTLTM
ncbi:MAG: hypothetical protein HUU30_16305 [Burkholderiaceae bacterium]|nr:hypothetical protein [Burkholderiaceae bacterium]NUP87298.1 hypothetical protein [Burkholderiaceae bacterium]